MLRISKQSETGVLVIELEGKLAGPWVKELESSWRSAEPTQRFQTVRLDLTSVDFIDQEGEELLEKMHGEGVELVASGCMNRCIVERIVQSREKKC